MDAFIKDDELLKNIMIFGIVSPFSTKLFMKTKVRSYGNETIDFYTRKIPEAGFVV